MRGVTRARVLGWVVVLAVAAATVVVGADVAPGATQAMLLGLGTGSLVGAIGLGLVLTHRGSGVVNFAAGAVATYSAYAFTALRRTGAVFLPPLPQSVGFGHPVGLVPAFALTLVLAAVLGAGLHLLVFRWLRAAPPLTRVIASVGVLLVLQALVVLRFTSSTLAVPPIFAPGSTAVGGGLRVPTGQLMLAVIVVGVAFALAALFRFTRFGLATRAAAENERAAMLIGHSPDLLAGLNWVLSTVLIAAFGILVASVNGSIDPATVVLLVVPALGAAFLGGFTSFGVTAAAAFVIAAAENLVRYASALKWFPHTGQGPIPGLADLVPLAAIVVVLVVREQTLPTRASAEPGRLPRLPPLPRSSRPRRTLRPAVMVVALAAVGSVLFGPSWRLALTTSLVITLLCLSLVVLTGFVGQISLAQMAFAGIAGFLLARVGQAGGFPFPLDLVVGALAATAVGVLAALPALRVRGVNLAVVTLAVAVSITDAVFAGPWFSGGFAGAGVRAPSLFGFLVGPTSGHRVRLFGWTSDGTLPSPWFGLFCLGVVALAAFGVARLRRSRTGQRMIAVRGNERAAAALGVDVVRTKLVAAAVSSLLAGVGGELLAYSSGSATAAAYGGLASLSVLAFAYLGGITSISGAVVGGCIAGGGLEFTALNEWFGLGGQYTLLIGGLGVVVTAVLNPEGVSGSTRDLVDRLLGAVRRDSPGAPPLRNGAGPATRPVPTAVDSLMRGQP